MADLVIRGAWEHNLQGLDLTIPRGRLTVVTGVSGSGKSSLAFDTIFREGQRRFLETLPAFARQFAGGAGRPELTGIDGLGPAVAVGQRAGLDNPRSTVGTLTEVWDLLRLLFALLPSVAAFFVWDAIAIARGHWTYSPVHTTGVLLPGAVPVEELVFFVVIPICGLLTWEAVGTILRRRAVRSSERSDRTGVGHG